MPLGKAGEVRGFASVGRYIQGPGTIRQLPDITKRFGTSAMVLVDPFFEGEIPYLETIFHESTIQISCEVFLGECSDTEIAKVKGSITQSAFPLQAIVGFGGGKTLDTVRVVAAKMGLPMILVPTSVASNAATSGLSVVYDERHVGRSEFLGRNPDVILVDTNYVIQAPARMLVSGIGDSFATYYEARNNWRTNNINTVMPGYHPTICGKYIAKACRDTLLEYGERAFLAAQNHLRTDEFEDTVEAINLLSGIGWENNGCSVAHGLVAAMPVVRETGKRMHGECVAFCLLVQLILDRESREEFETVHTFFRNLGLPVKLKDLGIEKDVEGKVRQIIQQAFDTQGILKITNYEINPDTVYNAIRLLDSI